MSVEVARVMELVTDVLQAIETVRPESEDPRNSPD